MVIDNKGKIIISNEKASLLTWYSNKYILGKNYKDIIRFVDENNNYLDDFVKKTINNEKEYSNSKNIHLKQESNSMPIPISIIITPLINFTVKWTAYVMVFKDITEEKRLENLKNEFLSIAWHELRTPMTVIRWYTYLFIRWKLGAINEKQKMYLEKIFSNTVGLINMVNDMLDVNKLEAWKMTFSYDKINITNTIKDSVDDMKELLKQKWVIIKTNLQEIITISDKDKIKQVVVNFLSNAYKFTDKWWHINVKLELENNLIKLSVIDSWIWIKKEDMEKLFKKFSQVWSYLNKTEKGTWLGLSICKQIIEEMWWNIFVESEYWKWSTFWFTLNLKNE
jgi:PAS domain S-box-containing protein